MSFPDFKHPLNNIPPLPRLQVVSDSQEATETESWKKGVDFKMDAFVFPFYAQHTVQYTMQ